MVAAQPARTQNQFIVEAELSSLFLKVRTYPRSPKARIRHFLLDCIIIVKNKVISESCPSLPLRVFFDRDERADHEPSTPAQQYRSLEHDEAPCQFGPFPEWPWSHGRTRPGSPCPRAVWTLSEFGLFGKQLCIGPSRAAGPRGLLRLAACQVSDDFRLPSASRSVTLWSLDNISLPQSM